MAQTQEALTTSINDVRKVGLYIGGSTCQRLTLQREIKVLYSGFDKSISIMVVCLGSKTYPLLPTSEKWKSGNPIALEVYL